jgi:hydrogenase expression/formation protein HypC
MCLGIPARIIAIESSNATVRIGKINYSASLSLLEHVSVGDYVILHAGFAIEKVDPKEAAETIRLFKLIDPDNLSENAR